MPIYEYRCNACGAVSNVFVRSFSSPLHPSCSRCKGTDLTRLVSRPNLVRSTLDRMEDYDIQRAMGRLEDPYDPAAVARWARQIGDDLGEEMGDEIRQMAEEVEAEQDSYDPYAPSTYEGGHFTETPGYTGWDDDPSSGTSPLDERPFANPLDH